MADAGWRRRVAAAIAAAIFLTIAAPVPSEASLKHRKVRHHPKAKVEKIEPLPGQFYSDGKPIDEFRCVPRGDGEYPVVLLLHGCAPKGFATPQFETMCSQLAQHGYYTMFIEYYGQEGTPDCSDLAMVPTFSLTPNVPIPDDEWMRTLLAAQNFISAAPKADASRLGVVGFSFGATLAVITAALNPHLIDTIVDYYGYSNDRVEDAVARVPTFPPTLILHGDEDRRAQVVDSIHLHDAIAKRQPNTDIRIYPGVEHAFNFHEALGYDKDASSDAWSRMLSFLDRHLK
jgi:carboxymethylenebutenolidase